MKRFSQWLLLLTIALVPFVPASAQSHAVNAKHFQKDDLSFDYPGTWAVADVSSGETQFFVVSAEDKTTQIAIIMQYDQGVSCASEIRSKRFTSDLVERVAGQIESPRPVKSTVHSITIGSKGTPAIEIHGVKNGKPITAYIVGTIIKRWFVNLVYLKPTDDETSAPAWTLVRSNLQIADPLPMAKPKSEQYVNGGVLNGKAIKLAQPGYPSEARSAKVSGVVVIEVEIDETGTVTLACARSGPPLLRDVSIDAARKSRFSPTTLNGKPVKVAGVIQYQFRVD